MPYALKKSGKRGYKVCKKNNSSKCFSKKSLTRKKALAQLAAMTLNSV